MVKAGKYSILVADNSRAFRDDLKTILDQEGHKTVLADCGEQALEIMISREIHLSILEMNLPDIRGIEIVRHLDQRQRKVPFIFLSEVDSKEAQLQALNVGAETLIMKPLDRQIITFTVNHILTKLFEGGRRHFPYS